ncbi:hypothetical protein ACB092_04G033400 [Castanea dentata]
MLLTVVSTMIFMKRTLAEIFSETVREIWNRWEVRVLVLLSLFLQIVLILLGKRRKYTAKNWLRILLWVAYLSADWVATVALGVLSQKEDHMRNQTVQLGVYSQRESDSKNQSFNPSYFIMASWVPFLLLHLGGPDTITAYSLEDNELWPRRLLELVVQFSVAFYVFLRALVGNPFNYLSIPMFIAGIIKFGERIWVLRSASSDVFRNSMLPRPDPGPDYAKFMDEYSSKKAEGFKTSVGAITDTSTVVRRNNFPDALHEASYFFRTFKRLFADLILSFQDRENSRSFFKHAELTCEKAFEVIEIELGFMYDLLYTKASLIHSYLGSICRFVSLLCTISAFIAFLIIDKNAYSTIDMSITFLLLFGAIVLEIFAVIVLLSSDWTTLWLSKHKNPMVDVISKANSFFQSCFGICFLLSLNKRWSNSVPQYNLMSRCIKRKSDEGSGIKDFISTMLEKHWHKNLEPVPMDLKKKIFEQLKNSSSISEIRDSNILFACTGDVDNETNKCIINLAQSMEVDFDEIILRWHIATDICNYINWGNDSDSVKNLKCWSKLLSNYLVYLLVMCPYMLPSGIGQIRFQDSCAEALQFIKERDCRSDERKACEVLFKVNTEILPSQIKGDRSKSVLFDACIIAQSLQFLETRNYWDTEQKWEKICQVWVKMLSYAASQCKWNYHARRLRQGGELITHVWLLMAHLGITEHFQISQGHLRAKLLLS